LQLNPPVHTAHAAPKVPHAAFVSPPRHTLPEQQPVGQFPTPHGTVHCPVVALQAVRPGDGGLLTQSLHAPLPAGPHAKSCVPATQVLPEQQPFLHVVPSHAFCWQTPFWQTWFAPHATQLLPE
jgi:hypothetical protein